MEKNQGNLNSFFNPKSVAIVGASSEEGKVGNVIAKNILELGYQGEVFLVNPKHKELLGKKCYSNVEEIGKKIDLVIVAVPSKFVNDVVDRSSEASKNFVIISSGFSETGKEGWERESELKKIAQNKRLNILGPNCLGFINPKLKLNASFSGGMPDEGSVAFVSQSGALAVALMDIAKQEHLGFSRVISIGNKMQLDEIEILEYLSYDPDTRVIALYLESISRGKEFIEVARKISKPVIILKAGRTLKAQKAISSHTGALAGSDEIMNAAFARSEALRAGTLEEFFGLISLCAKSKAPSSKHAAVITNAGGPGVLVTDAFSGKNIQLLSFSEDTKSQLKNFLPAEASVENPVDLLGDAKTDRYAKTLEVISEQKEIGSVICVLTPQDQTPVEQIADIISDFKLRSEKTVASVFIGGEKVKKSVSALKSKGIASFPFPDQAVEALDQYYAWQKTKDSSCEDMESKFYSDEPRKSKAKKIIEAVRLLNRNALLFCEAAALMELYAIPVIDHVSLPEGKKVDYAASFPVAVKVDSANVLHKSERQGVVLNVRNAGELEQAVFQMRSNFPGEQLLAQSMAEIKMELILGIKKDAAFGPVILFGIGGIYTEIFKTAEFLIPWESRERIVKRLQKGALGFLFRETRGQAKYNEEELADIIFNLQCLACEIDDIDELDINPMLVYNDGNRSIAVDIKIILSSNKEK